METLKQLLPVFISLSLAGLVFSVGLNATRDDILYVLKRPSELLKAILAVNIIPPLAAGLLVSILPLEPMVKAGIMLMSIAPVPPLVPAQEMAVGARKEYAYGIYAAMAILSIVAVPIALSIAARAFGSDASITMGAMLRTVLAGVLLPLAVGMGVRRFAPGFAKRAAPIVYKLAMVLVALAFAPVLIAIWPALGELIGNGTLLAMAAVVAIALLGGHLLGGPHLEDRAALAIASSVRHPGIAMMIANSAFQDNRVTGAVLLFLLVGLIIGIPYKMWVKRSLAHAHAT
jgi:BASS family bile acid:Na+ symporter